MRLIRFSRAEIYANYYNVYNFINIQSFIEVLLQNTFFMFDNIGMFFWTWKLQFLSWSSDRL